MRAPQFTNQNPHPSNETPLNESHINLMQSWQILRSLDNKLAQTKYKDMTEGPIPTKGRRTA